MQNGDVSEYYMMPAIDDDPSVGQLDYENNNKTSTFDSSRFPKNYKIIKVYHTHLSSNGPSKQDSWNAYRNSGKSFVISLRSNDVWLVKPYMVPPIMQSYGTKVSTIEQLLRGVKL